MAVSTGDTRAVRGLRGHVVRRTYARGSKSEREALMLETPEGTYLLRLRGGPSFGETGLEHLLGKTVACDGTLVEGRLLLVDRATAD